MNLSITEIEITRLLVAVAPLDVPLAKLNAQVTPEGVAISGEYTMMFSVPFQTLWELQAGGGGCAAHLKDLQVAGLPAGKFRGLLLKLIRDAVKDATAVRIEGERVWVDVPGLVRRETPRLRAEVTLVRCLAGAVEAEVVLRPN
jgi:hypothetical protein